MKDWLRTGALALLVLAVATIGTAGATVGATTPATTASPVPAPPPPALQCGINVSAGANLAAIVHSAPTGTTFCLASGTYKLTGPVYPKNSDSFVGEQSNPPIIDASLTTIGFDAHTVSDVTFEYVTVQGATGGGGPTVCSQCGRGIWGGDAMRVWDSTFRNNAGDGIAGGQNTAQHPWLIVGSTFSSNGSTPFLGVEAGGVKASSAFTILNSTASNNIGEGIWCDVGCTGGTWTVEGDTVTGNTGGGIRYEISNAGAVIEDNLVETNDTSNRAGLGGIQIASSGNATVENNTVLSNQRADVIMTNGRAPGLSNVLVHGNNASMLVGCSLKGVSCS